MTGYWELDQKTHFSHTSFCSLWSQGKALAGFDVIDRASLNLWTTTWGQGFVNRVGLLTSLPNHLW